MADVNIEIDVESKAAGKKLKKIEKELDGFGKSAKKAGKETDKSLALISKGAGLAAIAVAGIATAIGSAVNQASKLQDLETQFIAFTGSAEAAAEQVERIAEFSGETPFQLEELVTANRTLLAFGQSTEESLTTLSQLGDVAAGTGSNLGELALIFGQVEAAGKLTGERFLQFAERGINLAPILAEQLGVAENEIANLRKEGKITADDVAKAFETMTSEGGKFEGSMERLSLTFSGAASTLSDNAGLLASDFGKILLPAVTGFTVALTDGVKFVRQFTKETKADRLQAFNAQIETAQRNVKSLAQQAQAAGEGGILFNLFGGDPKEELKKANAELAVAITKLDSLKKKRAELEARPESDFDDPDSGAGGAVDSESVKNAKAISAEIETIAKQRAANRAAFASEENIQLAEQLDVQLELLKEKEVEKQIALLESQGQFQAAQELQAKASADKINQINSKAQKDQFNFEKKNAVARLKFNEQTWEQRASTAQAGLAALSSLQRTGSKEAFEIGKAAAIAQALITIPSTAVKAYDSLAGIPIVGPGLGAAAAAAAVVAGTARVNQIRSQKLTGFQDGGLVEGGIPGRDSVPALLTPGEVVVPRKNFNDLNIDNGEMVGLLTSIKDGIDLLVASQSEDEGTAPLNVELTLDGEVLASQILELNRDNARIA
jgi:tape measure domain-containing protein